MYYAIVCSTDFISEFNLKNDMWTEITNPCRFKSPNMLECPKFEGVDWQKVKVAFKFHQI